MTKVGVAIDQVGRIGHRLVGGPVLLDRAPDTEDHSEDGAEDRTDQQQFEADPGPDQDLLDHR
jgi:hypothetical protein